MPIVGGLDIHRKQLTFDYLDTGTGEVKRGQIAPVDRAHLRSWLARFAGRDDVAFALEGCTGWRYVAEELAGAGVAAHVAEPADTAFARGRKRHAKTDRTDSTSRVGFGTKRPTLKAQRHAGMRSVAESRLTRSRRLRCAPPRPGAASGSALGGPPGARRASTCRHPPINQLIASAPQTRSTPHASLLPGSQRHGVPGRQQIPRPPGHGRGRLICSRLCSPPGRFPAAIG